MTESHIVFLITVLLGAGIGLVSRRIKSFLFSIVFNAIASFLVVSIPVLTIFFIAEAPGLLPMVIPVLSMLMFATSFCIRAAAGFSGRNA
jgi:hypothetical protein